MSGDNLGRTSRASLHFWMIFYGVIQHATVTNGGETPPSLLPPITCSSLAHLYNLTHHITGGFTELATSSFGSNPSHPSTTAHYRPTLPHHGGFRRTPIMRNPARRVQRGLRGYNPTKQRLPQDADLHRPHSSTYIAPHIVGMHGSCVRQWSECQAITSDARAVRPYILDDILLSYTTRNSHQRGRDAPVPAAAHDVTAHNKNYVSL